MCWISGVVPFNIWLISSWEENKCLLQAEKTQIWHLFHSKLSKLSFWLKIIVILSVSQLVTTVIFFSAWDELRVKWYNSQEINTEKRTSQDWDLILESDWDNIIIAWAFCKQGQIHKMTTIFYWKLHFFLIQDHFDFWIWICSCHFVNLLIFAK